MQKTKSEYKPTHSQLVRRIAGWFKIRHKSSIVMAEFVTSAQEIPDVLTMQSGAHSVLVECKVSRSDFLSDKDKFFRRQEDYGMGDKRYYAAPVGLIKPEELPDGWGLLEVEERRIREIVEPKHKEANKRRECLMLMSALRRLEISTAVFVIQEEKTEDAQKIKEEAQQEAIVACHKCGAACCISGDDKEGTHYFIPLAPFEKSQD